MENMLCFESELSLPGRTVPAFCGDHFAKVRINEASINFALPCDYQLNCVLQRAESRLAWAPT